MSFLLFTFINFKVFIILNVWETERIVIILSRLGINKVLTKEQHFLLLIYPKHNLGT